MPAQKTKYLLSDFLWLLSLAVLPALLALKSFAPPLFTPSPIASATPTPPPTTKSSPVRVVYYDISGSNANELRVQMNKYGPVALDGYKGDAATTWSLWWDWPGRGTSACNLNAVTVSYQVEIKLPRWTPPENAPPDLVNKWSKYIRKLEAHEKGHANIVINNRQSVIDAIKGATCDTAEAAGNDALALIRQQDIDYDIATDHGKAEGVRFP